MGTKSSARVLPDGTPLQNRLLAALPTVDYDRIASHLRLEPTVVGDTLHEHGHPISDVYFPNGGVFSITTRMRDGELVEVATVGREGMLGIGVFLGDRSGTGRTFQQACNALHDVTQRCCRWLLQTHDRVGADDFLLKQEFLAVMLGVRRPTVTVVLRALQGAGLISGRYGRMRVLRRRRLEAASCECYGAIRDHFARLGLPRTRRTHEPQRNHRRSSILTAPAFLSPRPARPSPHQSLRVRVVLLIVAASCSTR